MNSEFKKRLIEAKKINTPTSYGKFSDYIIHESSVYDILENWDSLSKIENKELANFLGVIESLMSEVVGENPEEKLINYKSQITNEYEAFVRVLYSINAGDNLDDSVFVLLFDECTDSHVLSIQLEKVIRCIIHKKFMIEKIDLIVNLIFNKGDFILFNELIQLYNSLTIEEQSLFTDFENRADEYIKLHNMVSYDGMVFPKVLHECKPVVLKKEFPTHLIRPNYLVEEIISEENFATMNPTIELETIDEDDCIKCETEEDLEEINQVTEYFLDRLIESCLSDDVNVEILEFFANFSTTYFNDVVTEAGKMKKVARKIAAKSDAALQQVKKIGRDEHVLKILGRSLVNWERSANDVIEKIRSSDAKERRERILKGTVRVKLLKIVRDTTLALAVGTITLTPAYAALTLLVSTVLSKHFDAKQKAILLKDLEHELKIIEEKIDDARSDNDKASKYKLMRLKNRVERDINRIKYNLKDDYVDYKKEEIKK
ncbi:MAG: hypothetical protein PHF63_00455 [Herbinix sp.]|nr:hypothetical protein [Herbinix sp.]